MGSGCTHYRAGAPQVWIAEDPTHLRPPAPEWVTNGRPAADGPPPRCSAPPRCSRCLPGLRVVHPAHPHAIDDTPGIDSPTRSLAPRLRRAPRDTSRHQRRVHHGQPRSVDPAAPCRLLNIPTARRPTARQPAKVGGTQMSQLRTPLAHHREACCRQHRLSDRQGVSGCGPNSPQFRNPTALNGSTWMREGGLGGVDVPRGTTPGRTIGRRLC